ncbi:MAG: universal stress protein [Bombilactobacillus mellis]|uniref:universal stress protein n=1 Tax=Bombilactobacillus mellis TaxID=1218508 RepID=UPI0015808F98|nr:universal stress protein [Bombilactobacillus mellis]MBI0106964.1 universal stress protein [Lactobacillus sp. W8086]MBI0108428.1 universal stress protein [Lactobacillus sp. W8085]MBI0111646.1 universal stress protein [Lactobacillus sp. W8088]MBI0115361.1 universal stress protein [Lactobacillus sp. W8087]MBI0119086.1 universal stress protein [Lactobacillus sp. W8089]MBI0131051.1 universal stress protein [Lactobacillus sp. W8090]
MLQEYKRILAPVDGSDEAEIALKKATQVAMRNNATLDVLDVLDTRQFVGAYGGMLTSDVIYQITEDTENYLSGLQQEIIKTGLPQDQVKIHIRFGDPKTVIAFDFLKDYHDDLIILGSTGLNAMERILVGSVSSYVTRNALTDVIVVRTDLNNQAIAKSNNKK